MVIMFKMNKGMFCKSAENLDIMLLEKKQKKKKQKQVELSGRSCMLYF